ncbi:unknown [Prevotella sp. CAG:1058]|nr:unknown [Prevotella sp. CAG:1058]
MKKVKRLFYSMKRDFGRNARKVYGLAYGR